jgi:hypothetical protein
VINNAIHKLIIKFYGEDQNGRRFLRPVEILICLTKKTNNGEGTVET